MLNSQYKNNKNKMRSPFNNKKQFNKKLKNKFKIRNKLINKLMNKVQS